MLDKKIPIGIDNFAKLMDKKNNYLFADKSLLIKEIIEDKSEVTLITRPRRWGKTLNLSMLQHFFAIEIPYVETAGLFDNLAIAKVDGGHYMQYNRQSPVIFISFKDIKASSYEGAVEHIRTLLENLFGEHESYLMESAVLSENDKRRFNRYITGNINEAEIQRSLLTLSQLIFKHYQGKKVYILIDEYDTPLNAGYKHGYVEKMLDFMKVFLGAALKGNAFLQKGVLTGILRISHNSMLSGLNNLEVFTVLSKKYSSYFGFVEEEVKALFSECHLPHKVEEVRNYYNGYRFGDNLLYNPWSIINCLKNQGSLKTYWINTADDALLKDVLLNTTAQGKKQLQEIFWSTEGEFEGYISEVARFEGLKRDEIALWSLLVATGYLTAQCEACFDEQYLCKLRVPNQEVRRVYLNAFGEWLRSQLTEAGYLEFMRDLLSGRVEAFTHKLETYLLTYGTGHEFNSESNYHTFLLGLFAGLSGFYELYSNTPAGFGRADLMLVPKGDEKTAIILELKHTKTETVNRALAQTALTQIDRKRYAQYLQRYTHLERVLKIGVAFANRTVASCYRWEDAAGNSSGEGVTHLLRAEDLDKQAE